MALPKKKSRPITVCGVNFRYSISTTKIDDDWSFSLNLTIQIESGDGRILKVDGIVTRDMWLDFLKLDKYKKEDYPVFRPGDISRIIKAGLNDGWAPKEKGKPHVLKVDNSFLKNYAIK